LIASFVVILVVLMGSNRPGASSEAAMMPTSVALSATETPMPTPEPPTPTLLPPTSTPLPPTPEPPTATAAAPTAEAADTNGGSAGAYDPLLVAQGEQLFVLCSACHGADGRGVPNLGKTLVESEFVNSLTDEELANFVKMGRPIWDPANTSGIDMPPKGGNPAMTDEELMAIIAYIRTLSG
jgi:disulfide bond formation protein DsbB